MLGANSMKNMGRSTSSSLKSTSVSVPGKRDSFIIYLYKRILNLWKNAWSKTRSVMWVFSTGFIFLILPFSFAYMMEFQKQAAKVMDVQSRMV